MATESASPPASSASFPVSVSPALAHSASAASADVAWQVSSTDSFPLETAWLIISEGLGSSSVIVSWRCVCMGGGGCTEGRGGGYTENRIIESTRKQHHE